LGFKGREIEAACLEGTVKNPPLFFQLLFLSSLWAKYGEKWLSSRRQPRNVAFTIAVGTSAWMEPSHALPLWQKKEKPTTF